MRSPLLGIIYVNDNVNLHSCIVNNFVISTFIAVLVPQRRLG